MNAVCSLTGASAVSPLSNAACARRTTPGPASTRYGVPPATITVAGPERIGSGRGVPVPSSTTCVRVGGAAGCEWTAAARPAIAISTLDTILRLLLTQVVVAQVFRPARVHEQPSRAALRSHGYRRCPFHRPRRNSTTLTTASVEYATVSAMNTPRGPKPAFTDSTQASGISHNQKTNRLISV